MMAIIYMLTNTIDGKRYVGQTVKTLEQRWQGHVSAAKRDRCKMYVVNAIREHGAAAFERNVLEECDTHMLNERELYWIDKLKTHVTHGGYNLTLGGDVGLRGFKFSVNSRAKMSTSAKRRGISEYVRQRCRESKGWHQTDDAKARIGAGHMHPVEQYTLDGKFVKRFASIKEAAKAIDRTPAAISSCLMRNNKTAGFVWKRAVATEVQ